MAERRGIALITVMMILGLLVTMTGAFVTINHGNFALMAAASDQEEAVGACQAGYAYAFFSLEHDRRFGKAFREGESPTDVQLSEVSPLFTITVVDANTLSAQLLDADGNPKDARFNLEIVNNLPFDSKDSTPALEAAGPYPRVPPDCAFVRVTGQSGGVRRVLETMVTYAPLFDASAEAENLIDINAKDGIIFDSFDRFRNQVRSNSQINLLKDTQGANIRFQWTAMETELRKSLEADGSLRPDEIESLINQKLRRRGSLKAKDDIRLKGNSTVADQEFRLKQEQQARGNITPKVTREHQVLDLEFDDFRLSESGADVVDIKKGLYVFGSADYEVGFQAQAVWVNDAGVETIAPWSGDMKVSFPALERKEAQETEGTGFKKTITRELWMDSSSLPAIGASASDFNIPTPAYSTAGSDWEFKAWAEPPKISRVELWTGAEDWTDKDYKRPDLHVVENGKVRLSDIASGPLGKASDSAVTIDIAKAEFRVRENLMLNSPGEFGVLAETDRYANREGKTYRRRTDAQIIFGVKDGHMNDTDLRISTDHISQEGSAVRAKGKVRVRNVQGRGALIAGDDLTIAAGGNTKSDDLALYSANDVVMNAATDLDTGGSSTEVTTGEGDTSIKFRGLVYARHNFTMENTGNNKDVLIEGSLVARNEIQIKESNQVTLTYNPLFARKWLKDRPDWDVRLERQSYNLF